MICSYDLDIPITSAYEDYALKVLEEIRDPDSILPPYSVKEKFPKIFEPVKEYEKWLSKTFRIFAFPPKRPVVLHIDSNQYNQYPDMAKEIVVPQVINIPIRMQGVDTTYWYKQTTPAYLKPWEFFKEDRTDIEFEEIHRHTITNKPVLFNTSEWHAVENTTEHERVMVSFFFHHTVTWNTAKSILKEVISSSDS
jgi:hypothetical protein